MFKKSSHEWASMLSRALDDRTVNAILDQLVNVEEDPNLKDDEVRILMSFHAALSRLRPNCAMPADMFNEQND